MSAEVNMTRNMNNLKQKPFFSTEEAKSAGISPRMLSYYTKKGEIERIAHGLYRSAQYIPNSEEIQWHDLALAAKNIKQGIICLLSALSYYELIDEFVNEYWIAVPNSHSRVHFPMARVVRMRNMTLGVNSIILADMKVQIFNEERCVIEAFKILDIETAITALKSYMTNKHKKPNIKKLLSYGKILRVDISKYILPFTL